MSPLLPNLSTRSREAEWMDETDDAETLRASLRFIRRVNIAFGYTRAILKHLDRLSAGWQPRQRITILDLATGSGDIPRAILAWASRRGFNIRITAIDRHPVTVAEARTGPPDDRLTVLQSDVFSLPFERGSFDYAITSMFLHHLDDEQVVQVMGVMDRLARRGVIISDLLRHRRAYAWIKLFTLFSAPIIRHDAAVSVAQAFRRDEIERLRDQAGLSYAAYHRHFGHRFILCGEKPNRSL
jgi:ubiquinone/menaquinone biosynthesis C-methylase UbiE